MARQLGDAGDHEVARITTAPEARSADISRRQRRYVVSMTIRTLCFVGAIVVGGGWLRWVLVAGAFILPYVAVVMANSAAPRLDGPDLQGPGPGTPQHPELGGSAS